MLNRPITRPLAAGPSDGVNRLTRRRSSAGPIPPNRPLSPRDPQQPMRGGARATFLALRDHGKVFVADLPRLSDGQLCNVVREAREVLESLNRRIDELQTQINLSQLEQETIIRASTKRDVTERFIRAVEDEQEQRRTNPALKAAAGESLSRTFLELARHRLPGATFDSLLQEAVCILELETGLKLNPDAPVPLDGPATGEAGSEPASAASAGSDAPHGEPLDGGDADGPNQPSLGGGPTLVARPLAPRNFNVVRHAASPEIDRQPLPVVLSPDPSPSLARPNQS